MTNPINAWIRDGKTPGGKDKRRFIVAGVCAVAGIVLAPFTYGISLLLLVVAIVKVKNAWVDAS